MALDPRSTLDLRSLFVDPKMFASRDRWRRAGFHVFDRLSDDKIMVAHHDAAPGYLFKKYVDAVDEAKQIDNYERRIDGANRVRAYVDDRRLHRIVVPHKWLYRLSDDFGSKKRPAHVLVVDRVKLLDDSTSKHAYASIDAELLRQLCAVLMKFRGLDSAVMNVPFTDDGRLAFIDTEHWNRRSKSKKFLDHISAYLSKDGKKLAKKIHGDDDDNDDDEDNNDYDDSSDYDESSDS